MFLSNGLHKVSNSSTLINQINQPFKHQKAGLKNTAIMKPYGINGWKALGLPVAGTQALEQAVAQQQLQKCVKNHDECLRVSK